MPNTAFPTPTRHCAACGRGHYAAVAFCPFCGAAQSSAARGRPEAASDPTPAAAPESLTFHLEHEAAPVPRERRSEPRAAEPARPMGSSAPDPVPPASERAPPPRRRIGRAVPVLFGFCAVAAVFLAQRPHVPAPVTVTIGPAWTGIALDGFKAVPSLRLSAEAPFSLRLDGERVQRVAPGTGSLVRLRGLRGLELRSARGRVPILLTPQGE